MSFLLLSFPSIPAGFLGRGKSRLAGYRGLNGVMIWHIVLIVFFFMLPCFFLLQSMVEVLRGPVFMVFEFFGLLGLLIWTYWS
jgi:hypothetical protein